MIGPGELLRAPGDAVGYARRLLAEVIAARIVLETAVERLQADIDELKAEVVHIRRRVDEVADAAPTRGDDGPLARVRDALTPDS